MRIKTFVLLLLVLFFFIKLMTFLQPVLYWDEAVYVGMGKYIYSGGEVGLWEEFRPVTLPLIHGFFWKIGFKHMLFNIRIVNIFFSLGYLWMTYLISKELFGEVSSLLTVLLLLSTPVFFFFSNFALTSIPSTFFSLLSIWMFLKKKFFMTGLFAGVSFLFRFPQALILLVFLFFLKKNKNLFPLLTGFSLTVIPFFVLNFFLYRNPLTPLLTGILHQSNIAESVIDGTLFSYIYNLFFYVVEFLRQNLLYGFFFLGFGKIRKSKIIIGISLLFFIYFTYILNKQVRFMLIFLPFITMIAANNLFSFLKKINFNKALIVLIIIAVLPSFMMMHREHKRVSSTPYLKDFYTFFENKEVAGDVLSTSPFPVMFSDIKIIPFYNNIEGAVFVYNQNKDAEVIIYTTEFYPCFDEECYEKRDDLFESIKKDRKTIYHDTLDQEYYIFS